MKKTVVELFAGVGGFRCGLNNIKTVEDAKKPEKWETVWFSQWEPGDKKTQWAHDCYINHFGTRLNLEGNDTTNDDIHSVNKETIPDHTLLVGGFPCQNYSVASTLATSKGIEGEKGVLWWDIRDILEIKQPPFVLLENVDRLLKSPAKQRGRDFGIILACFRDLGYTVEWRVLNAAEYGYQQRRKRTFIFAYKNNTNFKSEVSKHQVDNILEREGFFAKAFDVNTIENNKIKKCEFTDTVGEISENFHFEFENSGLMMDNTIYTIKTVPIFNGKQRVLGDLIENDKVDKKYFIPEKKLYYTTPDVDHSDETQNKLSVEEKKTWQYIKGAKKMYRKATNGYEYIYSEGAVALVDEYDKPARTMLTSEGSFSRTTHVVRDRETGKLRLLTPKETERIQGFPDDWTKDCLVNGEEVTMPDNKRRFMMGNALVVDLIKQLEPVLNNIINNEH